MNTAVACAPSWNEPGSAPAQPGEYRAALDPTDTSPDMRRWWNGRCWSHPYSCAWPQALKQSIRQQLSCFRVYWMPT